MLLMACKGAPDGGLDESSSSPTAETASDTAVTEPCAQDEVIANGWDDDCDGWADEYGPGGHSVTDGSVAFHGVEEDFLGMSLSAGRARDGTPWLVAGGGEDAGSTRKAHVHAAPQPGGPLMQIVSQEYGGNVEFGRAVGVGAFDDGPMSVIASDSGEYAGLYRASEGTLHQKRDATTEIVEPAGNFQPADLDGDGFDELAYTLGDAVTILRGPVGEPVWDNVQGRVYAESPVSKFGYWMGEIADLSGDGIPEISAWSVEDAGQVWLVSGDIVGEVALADVYQARLYGEQPFDGAGESAAAGDANGDGYLDLLAGASTSRGSQGTAYLVYGPLSGDLPLAEGAARIEGDFDVDWCGGSVAFLPDVDGDGADDLAVGCGADPFVIYLPGRIQLYRGLDAQGTLGLADAATFYVGPHPGDLAGTQMESKYDLTGDGVPDLAVGVPRDETFAPWGGVVYVLPGPLL